MKLHWNRSDQKWQYPTFTFRFADYRRLQKRTHEDSTLTKPSQSSTITALGITHKIALESYD